MSYEKASEQTPPKPILIENFVSETNDDLPGELLNSLLDDIDNPKSFDLLVGYLKNNLRTRLPEVIRELNFDFGTSSKSFDVYNDYRQKIEQLLEEKDGIIDASKREQARLLLKVIKSSKVTE